MLYEIHEDGIQTFRKIELITFVAYILLLTIIMIFKFYIIYVFVWVKDGDKLAGLLFVINGFLIAMLLTVFFVVFTYTLKKYHVRVYGQIWVSLWVFYGIEMV